MYSKLEAAAIFKNCKSIQEIEKVGSVFGYMHTAFGYKVPKYVNRYAHLRYRSLLK